MPENPAPELIRVQGMSHIHGIDATARATLRDVSLTINAGQSCAIIGASGSGKSTLLGLIGLLDQPSTGQVYLAGRDMTQASADARAMMRNRHIGFVFQSFNLLPRLDALDNVALALLYRGISRQAAQAAARRQLLQLGLGERLHHRPAQLSGGQRQRVAIARALVGEPALLLADEPTGNLDSQTASEVIELLLALNRERGVTLIVVTHDPDIAKRMQRCLRISEGRLWEMPHD
ncbi:ABC transporter ATP-binding protein [Pseudomonas sp. Z1-29]|uniref:ABC transporter ATP-binding protein n=1 Tax=unclassified Pseudomonas TaxID=196821 RepID=UPI003DA9F679